MSWPGWMQRSGQSLKRQSTMWLWLLPGLYLALFFFYPLGSVFQEAFAKGLDLRTWSQALRPLGFTFWQAALSCGLTLILGLPAAFVFAHYSFPFKRLLQALITLPFILPTVVVAAAFNALLGPRGWVNLGLMSLSGAATPPLQVMNSLAAILLAHVFYNTAVVLLVVGSAWAQLNLRQEQASRVLGASAWRTLWEVTLPLLRPSILAAALLVFLFDFTSYGVILLLGGPRYATLEVEIYIQTMQMLNLPLAGLLSAVQLACTLAISLVYMRLSGGQAIPLLPRLKGEGLRRLASLHMRERILAGSVLLLLFVFLVSPLAALVLRSVSRLEASRGEVGAVTGGLTLDYYRELFINRRGSIFYVPPVQAARNSLVYACISSGLSLSLGFLAVYALRSGSGGNASSVRRRKQNGLNALLMLPLGASAVTLGLGFLLVFNRPPLDLRSFPWLVPVAHSLVALPFVVRTLQPALDSIPANLRQAAAVLGATPIRIWVEVDLPLLGRAVLVSAILSFTISLGEFGATSFLARPEYPTLPVAIYRFLGQAGAMNYGQALALATLLMLVCGLSILVMEKVILDEG